MTHSTHSQKLSEPLVRTDVYLSAQHRDMMKQLGAAQDISMAELIRRCMDQFLKRELKKQAAKEVASAK